MGDFVATAICQRCGMFIYPAGHPMLGRKGGGEQGVAVEKGGGLVYCVVCAAYNPPPKEPVTELRCEVCLGTTKNCSCGRPVLPATCAQCGKAITRGTRCWACYKADYANGRRSSTRRK